MVGLTAVEATTPIKQCFSFSGCAKDAANSMINEIVKAFGQATIAMLKFLSTFWMEVPSPTVATGGGSSWHTVSTISQMQGWLGPFTALIAVGSYSVAVTRIGLTSRGEDVRKVVRQVAAVGAGTLIITAGTQLLITAGDEFSPWIISQASGGDPSKGMELLIATGFGSGEPTQNIGLWLIVFILSILGGMAQWIFMIMRGAVLMVLMVFVAPVAAGAASDDGWDRFKRFGLIIVGFALYKPVAAIIYATGISLMSTPTGSGPAASGGNVKEALYGLTVMVLAAAALPSFIKFLLPLAATGSSSMFSGAAVAGVVAAGAAIIATGGAGAAAGASAGGAGSAGAAGKAGSAGSAGAGVAGPTGGSGPGGPSGGSGAGGPSGGSGAGESAGATGSGASSSSGSGGTASGKGGGREFAHAMASGAQGASERANSAEVEDES